jgi:Uma2 family endonuclease
MPGNCSFRELFRCQALTGGSKIRPRVVKIFAPCDVLLSETDILVPDLIYISKARAHVVTLKNLQGAPDLAIEILSPSTMRRDRNLKRAVYERAGVEEYWLVDPEAVTIEVFASSGEQFALANTTSGRERVRSLLLPGLALLPADLVPA